MKKKILFLISLILIFAAFVAVRSFMAFRSGKEGRIQIISSPASNVIINNEAVGRTPYESSLPIGEYNVRLQPDEQEASGSATWEGKISVTENTRTFVSREIGATDIASSGVILTVEKMTEKPAKKGTGEIQVLTEPDGSIVFLDDEEQGIAPFLLSEVPEGDHELSVFSPGFFRRSQKIKIQEGYRVIAEFKLAVDPTHKKVVKEDSDKDATDEASLDKTDTSKKKSTSSDTKIIEILKTGTGWLRVRQEPTVNASEAAKVDPGDQYEVLEERDGWIKIEYSKNEEGWVSDQYVREVEEKP